MTIIYRAYNIITKKSYIGQTIYTLSQRKYQHFYVAEKYNHGYHFMRALRFYQKDDWEWEILEKVDKELANEKERFYIHKFNSFKNGYNKTWGGKDAATRESVIYSLWHPTNGEIKGTAREISDSIHCPQISIYQLTSGVSKSIKGYILLQHKENYEQFIKYRRLKPNKPKPEKKNNCKYKCSHPIQGEYIGTINELSRIINYSDERVRHLIRGKCKNLKGWKFLTKC